MWVISVFSLRMRRIRSVQKKWRKPNWRPGTLTWGINPADPICSEKDCRRGWDSFILSFYSRRRDENHFILLLDHWVIRRDTDHRSLGSRTSQHHVTESWATDGVRTVTDKNSGQFEKIKLCHILYQSKNCNKIFLKKCF